MILTRLNTGRTNFTIFSQSKNDINRLILHQPLYIPLQYDIINFADSVAHGSIKSLPSNGDTIRRILPPTQFPAAGHPETWLSSDGQGHCLILW